MYYNKKEIIVAFLLASLAGVILHFVYNWFPSTATALIAPVSESLWEHSKLIFFPGLVASLVLSYGRPGGLSGWLFSLVVACCAMLAVAYLFHIVLDIHSLPFDIGLYFAAMLLLFWLAPRLGGKFGGWLWLVPLAMTIIFWVLLTLFTFSPPQGNLFQNHEASPYTMCKYF